MLQVSIIIPAYNSSKFISKTINSILVQDHKNIELIIVDDGSTDTTASIVNQLKVEIDKKYNQLNKYRKIKYYYKKNEGASSARNFGIHKASSEFIGFLDADDVFLPEMVSECLRMLTKGNYDLVSVDNYKVYYDGDEEIEREIESYDWIEKDSAALFCTFLKIGAIGGIHKAFFRRSVFERVGLLDTTLKVYEDLDLWVRIARHSFKWGHIRKPLLEYNHRGSGSSLFTHSKKRNLDHRLRILKRNKKYAITICPYFHKDYAELLWNFGREYVMQHKKMIKAFMCFSESFITDPDFKRVIKSLKTRLTAILNL